MNYEELEKVFSRATACCDPIDFVSRQRDLSYALAKYLLERDKPMEETEERDKSCSK